MSDTDSVEKILEATERTAPNVLAVWVGEVCSYINAGAGNHDGRWQSQLYQNVAMGCISLSKISACYARLYPSEISEPAFAILASVMESAAEIAEHKSHKMHEALHYDDADIATSFNAQFKKMKAAYVERLSKIADMARGHDMMHGAPTPPIACGTKPLNELGEIADGLLQQPDPKHRAAYPRRFYKAQDVTDDMIDNAVRAGKLHPIEPAKGKRGKAYLFDECSDIWPFLKKNP